MNTLKRTLALVATLAMSATAFVGCGSDDSSSEATTTAPAATDAPTEGEEPTDGEEPTEGGNSTVEKSLELGDIDSSLKTGGDTFTVAAWDANDVPALLAAWKGETDLDAYKEKLANDEVSGIKFINFGVGGGQAAEQYNLLLNEGTDLDVYFCEADWALNYINDDTRTVGLDKLGFSDANFAETYSYTDAIGKDENGVRKGVSWQAAGGGFAYRADLAEEYLGVKSPEEMQTKIGDWDKFVAAAETIADKTGNTVALADSLGGMWQAYACGRTTPWVSNDKVEIDATCEAFAKHAKTLWDCGGVTKNNQWSDAAWTASGVNGSCMGYFVSTWGYGGFFMDAAGGVNGDQYGKWAVCQGPVPYYWGGTWMVVHPNTDNAKEAQEFIFASTVDTAAMKAYAVSKPEFVNNSVAMAELIESDTVFNKDITGNFKDNQNIYAKLYDNVESIDFNGLITPYDAACKTEFINAVRETYLDGGKSWDETKEDFLDKASVVLPGLNWD
mgnify:CR=1 FL=1